MDIHTIGEPVWDGERGGHAGPGPGDAAGRAAAAYVPAEEAGEEDGCGRLGAGFPAHHGGHLW